MTSPTPSTPHPRPRRLTATLLALALSLIGVIGVASPAAAAGSVDVALSQTTGTEPFDADDAEGHDSSATNDLVRTNDTITYSVSVTANEADLTDPVITLSLPRGQEVAYSNLLGASGAIPAFCDPTTSTLTPATIAAPSATDPLSSWASDPAQTLVCHLTSPVTTGSAQVFQVTARVRPEVPGGTVMDPVSAVVEGTQSGASVSATTGSVEQTVSATSAWDLSINGAESADDSAFVKQATVQKCTPRITNGDGSTVESPWAGQWCYVGGYPVTLSIPNGGRGGTPIQDGTFGFTIDTSATAIWGQSAVEAATAAGATLPGALVTSVLDDPYGSPYSRIVPGSSSHAADRSVRASGTTAFTQTVSADGSPSVSFTVTGTDTTGYTLPYQAGDPANTNIRPDRGYVYTKRVFLEVPVTALDVLDNVAGVDADDASGVIVTSVGFEANESGLTLTGVDGSANTWADPDGTADNYRTVPVRLESTQAVDNWWGSSKDYPTSTTPVVFSPGYPVWTGPSGPTGWHQGDGVAVNGQKVVNVVHIDGNSQLGNTTLACVSFDESQVQVDAGTAADGIYGSYGAVTSTQWAPYTDVDTGGATWIDGSLFNFNSVRSLDDPQDLAPQKSMTSRYNDFRVQYGVGDASDTGCTGSITWSDTPSAATNHVRVLVQAKAGTNAVYQRTDVAISMKVVGSAIGDVVPTHVSYVQTAGSTSTMEEMSALVTEGTVITSTYDAASHTYDSASRTRWMGDRLSLVGDMVRVSKTVDGLNTDQWVPSTDSWVRTAGVTPPTYAPGNTFDYTITPALTSAVPSGQATSILVEDCLPAEVKPVAYSVNPTAVTLPEQLACDAGETHLAWQLDGVTDKTALDPITVTVQVLETAASNTSVVNDVLVSSPTDPSSTVNQRSDRATVAVQAPAGVAISKRSVNPTIVVNDHGWTSGPTVDWQVVFRSLDNPLPISDMDVIDYLPAADDGASSFAGTGDLVSATATSSTGTQPTLLYTSSPLGGARVEDWTNARDDALNGESGSTVWCDAPSGGTVVLGAGAAADCPASPSAVTGLRVLRPGQLASNATITLDISTTAAGNHAEDKMVNHVQGSATGLDTNVSSRASTLFVAGEVPGSVTGTAWHDTDGDGLRADGEPLFGGVTVELVDADGEVVLDANGRPMSTTTAQDGTYSFTGLAPGSYTVRMTLPDGYQPTLTDVDGNTHDGVDSDGTASSDGTSTLAAVTLDAGHQDVVVDQGFVQRDLAITKTAAADHDPAQVGDTITYTVTVSATGETSYSAAAPAVFYDDLSDVLDNADLGSVTSVSTGTAGFDAGSSTLMWSGVLAPGESATVTYTVTVTGAATDGEATNTAFTSTIPPVDSDGDGTPDLPGKDGDGTPVAPPTTCEAPTCATTTTPIGGPVVTPTAPTTTVSSTAPAAPGSWLARTGTAVGRTVLVALVLLTAGGLLLVRRRRQV